MSLMLNHTINTRLQQLNLAGYDDDDDEVNRRRLAVHQSWVG